MKRHVTGFALNALVRISTAAFLVDVLRHPHDPRYEGKAIPIRNLLVVGGLGLVFPLLYISSRPRFRWRRYPVWSDTLYLSIFWLDMAGNYLDLYDRYTHFDLIPHFHGTGAFAAVLLQAFDMPPLAAIGTTNGIHTLLEAQEYLTDVFCGTHNVRGAWDSIGDLSSGLLGTIVYVGLAHTRCARSPTSVRP
ncbi:MAG TPA: hypothetical protein VKQ30_11705 [Ktedonobacterales bacterium]|nr:hypothetical protein [Ktedonobacterales bacterium]